MGKREDYLAAYEAKIKRMGLDESPIQKMIRSKDDEIARLRERTEILEAELRVTRKIAEQNIGEQSAEIARLREEVERLNSEEMFARLDREIARLRHEKAELVEAAMKIDRMALVIESAVRNRKDGNYSVVLFALKANEAAIRSATEKGEPT